MDPLTSPLSDDPLEAALERAVAAIDALPGAYGEQLASVAIVVQEEPSAEQLDSVGATGLLGLYQGVPRTAYGADGAPHPSRITLFRGPLMRTYRTPDALRGRVNAVNMVFVGASNELGEFRAGMMAAGIGTVPAVVFGGIGTLAVAAIWAALFPQLRKARSLAGGV